MQSFVFGCDEYYYQKGVNMNMKKGIIAFFASAFFAAAGITAFAEAYTPGNLMFTSRGNVMVLSWTNPDSETLDRISLYEFKENDWVLIDDGISAGASETIVHKLTGVSGTHQYKIVYSFSDSEEVTYYLGGSSGGAETETYGGWTFNHRGRQSKINGQNIAYCPGRIYIDTEVSYDGSASLKMTSNIDRNKYDSDHPDSMRNDVYLQALHEHNMELGKTYEISYWVKTENVKKHPVAGVGPKFNLGVNKNHGGIVGTYDWQEIKYTYTHSSASNVNTDIQWNDWGDGFWVDNIEIYEIDENGNRVTGENIFNEGDFENLVSNECTAITSFTAEPGVNDIMLNIETGNMDYRFLKLYENVSGEWEYRGEIARGINNLKITGLEMGTEYSYRVIPLNFDYVQGTAVDVTAKTIIPEYEISGPVLYKKNVENNAYEEIEALNGSGDYRVVLNLKNNLDEDGLPIVQFVTVYDSDNIMRIIKRTADNAAMTPVGDNPYEVSTEFTIPEDVSYTPETLEYFAFDSVQSLNLFVGKNIHKIFK